MRLWTIQATGTLQNGKWKQQITIPTFHLDRDLLGIVSKEHAEKIALHMLTGINPQAEFHVFASEV